jgi:hypothetical protein
MAFCADCGHELKPGARFCFACGLEAAPGTNPPAPGSNDPLATPRPPAFGLPPQALVRPAVAFSYNKGRAIAVYVCLGLTILGLLAMISTISTQRDLLERVERLEDGSGSGSATEALTLLSKVRDNDDQVASVNALAIVLFFATATAFGFWVHRAYKNLLALNGGGLASSPSFAVWSAIIPVANIFLGLQRLKEIWQGSAGSDGALAGQRSDSLPWFISAWWVGFGLLLVARFALGVAKPADGSSDGVNKLQSYDSMAILVSAAAIVLAAFGAYAVMRITQRQSQAFEVSQRPLETASLA